MKSNYKRIRLGNYIERITRRNTEQKYGIDDVRGVTNTKKFAKTRANLLGRTFEKFYIVKPKEFVFNRRTTRMGERFGLGYNEYDREYIFTEDYVPFRINDEALSLLMPEYLYLFFCRDEFDRYVRYQSAGSATEFFNWEDMCKVELPVPPIEKQAAIVRQYKTIADRIALKQRINDNLVQTLQEIYKERFKNKEYTKLPLDTLCSKIGSGATPKGGKESYHEEGISLIRSTNVFDFRFSYPDLAHIDEAQAKALDNVTVCDDDVLFNITGVSVARCCMVPANVLPARVNQHVMILRPKAGKYMSYYLMCALCDNDNKALLLGIGQSGSTREAINKQEMEAFQIAVPPGKKMESFGKVAESIYKVIHLNETEIALLLDVQKLLLAQLSSRNDFGEA